jgi:lipoprotein-anchoring transpeptidase ErfK/SrfK
MSSRPGSVSIFFGLILLLGLGLIWPDSVHAADVRQSPNELMPPLPAKEPQIGPLIRRDHQDDVELRTTAFIPRSLDHLTAIELPDTDERWIRVDLSEQQVIAYQGQRPVRGFIISSGLPDTPTLTGEFRIRTKVTSQTMTGGDPAKGTYYDLANVKWVQYFVHEYAFHGTWWHNDFGRPKSHGCINMTNADAKWLFDWASPTWDGKAKWFHSTQDEPGTRVIVHE